MTDISFIKQGYTILGIYKHEGFTEPHDFIAHVARTCYKSEPRTEGADERLVRSLIKNEHDAMLEHSFMSVKFVTDRAIANELVRHRHFSFAQESTRYVNSSKTGFEFILPSGLTEEQETIIKADCIRAAEHYETLVWLKTTPEIARSVLPLCTATRIVCSGNFRSWRDMFKLRTDKHAHPQMRELMTPLLNELKSTVPVLFDDMEMNDEKEILTD